MRLKAVFRVRPHHKIYDYYLLFVFPFCRIVISTAKWSMYLTVAELRATFIVIGPHWGAMVTTPAYLVK